jgi:uncharacterized protein YbjT (DUF2867 family)
MADVLVTGGTGTLGRRLVPRLLAVGHQVRVLTRRPSHAGLPPDVRLVTGDVRSGAGLAAAIEGVHVVVHAASSPLRRMRETEVAGTGLVAAAARDAGAHLIYVSIVGVDDHRYPYYRAKLAAERVVADSGAGWTVQRATQFHELLDFVLGKRVFLRTPRLAFQVVDAGEVADRLVELTFATPQGRAADFGGPEVLSVVELNAVRTDITGKRARLLPVPPIGWLADFDRGAHLAPERRAGKVTWGDWLRARGEGN